MTSHIINSNSVQSQLSALVNDKERFKTLEESAQQNRKVEETNLELLKREQCELNNAIRKAHSDLGVMKKRRQHLIHDKEMLMKKIDQENMEMKRASEKIHNLEEEDIAMKNEYCKDMEASNDERLILMKKVKDKRMSQLITACTCQELIHDISTRYNVLMKSNGDEIIGAECCTESDKSESMLYHEALYRSLLESCNRLVKNEEKFHSVKKMEKQLQDEYLQARCHALHINLFVDEQTFDEMNLMEHKDNHHQEPLKNVDTDQQRLEECHMQLFYE